ncbi:hypothetical protein C5167_026242 [Papaver somniferum]|uniref:uncharacterized protein LOC113346319 n=1 Tax=Papaver somniferum TaxID=3469 RepID=UPI000E701C14|nr:uncharacterized protein LOC113346319 [Papaver somniferum]RZC94511.1 hypothetical protein C5167_026242 [Papaver somniferum]
MNNYRHREENSPLCDFHPKQAIIGICPLCLKERLVILASKQGSLDNFIPYYKESSSTVHHETSTATSNNVHHRNKSVLALKIFALRSFLHRHLEFRKSSDNFHVVDADCQGYESTSQEDSFISIKFQDNEVVSWDKGTKNAKEENLEKLSINLTNKEQTRISAKNQDIRLPSTTTTTSSINKNNSSSVVEHVKSHAVLKWRKRIGQLFQIMRWKKRSSTSSNKTNVNHVMINNSGGAKMRKGNWIRTLTKRR